MTEQLNNTVDVTKLYDYVDELAKLYKMNIQNANAKASGTLFNFTHDVRWDGQKLSVVFNLPDYWYYIEEGRKPTVKSEGGVLWQIIRNWIDTKGIVPRDGKDKDSLASAITKSIHKLGYFKPNHTGKHLLQNALNTAKDSGLIEKITNSVVDDMEQQIKVSLKDLSNLNKK